MSPLVSILIPCFNAARWLREALESALRQTWPRCEIIVVDDGSTDASAAIAAEFEGRGVRLIRQPNAGQSAACNQALRHARGEWVKFFDSDDLLSPDMIERQVRSLSGQPTAVAYGEWARFTDNPGAAQFISRPGWHSAPPVDWLVELWADGQPMMQCGQFLLPRRLLDQTGGWDERLSLINDFEFFARVALASSQIVFTPGARLYYRSGLSGSLSRSTQRAAWESAARSATLGTDYLLAAEDSPRTRAAAASYLQELVFSMYPHCRDLVRSLERRVAELGGCARPPQGGRGFQLARRIVGWKAARHLQVWAGRFPAPRS